MEQKTYSVADIAAMSGLSVRTVRSYLAMGLLEGEKVDGAWHFTPEQFSAFLAQDMVRQSVQAKAQGIVSDFLRQERRAEAAACTVLDLPADFGEEARLREALLARINALGLSCSYRYDLRRGLARCILQGPPQAVAALLSQISQQP